ncbi:mechanosensitive ion channel domain-containing protein [Pseudonocardia acidicola]|uniref:Mechanosensitive ion channel family protein n=1 Tax=Pseudonocardia acidicola TaxID=2724939 RepID=A0ABX1SIV2_9PSEU|nr:mechanosensitive ion channel family protein [Pseudonocardia acidicola]NMI00094.1 mechanosensitive ion channel family protein [Pseudonocardia acidicola]
MAAFRLRRPRSDGHPGGRAAAALDVLDARIRPDLRRAVVAGALALAALTAGSNLGGLNATELHTRLIVIGLAVVFVLLGIVATRSTATQLGRAAGHAGPGAGSATKVLCLLVGYLVVFVGALGLLTIPLQQLLVGGALTGVIVGIAAQQPLSNVFAGLLLLLARPVVVGQRVCIHSGALGGPLEGTVADMGLIYTTLTTEDEVLSIPNAALLNSAIRAPAVR